MIQYQYLAPAFARFSGTHQTRSTSTNDHNFVFLQHLAVTLNG